MKLSSEPGAIVSGVAHAALLACTLVAFSDTRKFEDVQETVPVEVLTNEQFNQITRGEKTEKEVTPKPVRADRAAEVEDRKPPPKVEAKVDVTPPLPPLKPLPDPGHDDTPEPPKPPTRVAALPPPEPPKVEPPRPPVRPPDPPKAEKPPEPPKPDAEAIEPPQPPQRPKEEPKKAEVTPPMPVAKPRPAPKEPPKPKPEEKPLDTAALSKLLEKADLQKPTPRPKSGDETSSTAKPLDLAAIQKILSHEPPGQRPSTAREISRTASLGAPTANSAKISPSMASAIDGFIVEQYTKCWVPPPNFDSKYWPQIRISYALDGSLQGMPELMNPSSDPRERALADSVQRAIRNPQCNPMRFPASFMPYFDYWRGPRILRFNPSDMMG